MEKQIRDLFIADVKRRLFRESVPRIIQCVNSLTDDEIWFRQNRHCNSVGNLILHLCGNARQYILSGIDGQKDIRERDLEFSFSGEMRKEELIEKMLSLMIQVDSALDRITSDHLVEEKQVQGFDETVISILVHVVEHFSYHTGQIAYFTKYWKDVDLEFYKGMDLNAKSE